MILHASPDPNDPPQQILDLQAENLAALAIVPVLFESDRMAVLQMDNGVRVLRDFTEARNREALLDAINAPLPILGNGTALYDSIKFSLDKLAGETGRRKAIVIFSSSANTFDTNLALRPILMHCTNKSNRRVWASSHCRSEKVSRTRARLPSSTSSQSIVAALCSPIRPHHCRPLCSASARRLAANR